MKKLMQIYTLLLFALYFSTSIVGQEKAITKEFKAETISTLTDMMNERYVFPEIAKKTGTHLKAQLKAGHFDKFENIESFAEALTESVQSINKDKHMRVRPAPPYEAPENSPERMIEEKLDQMERSRQSNAGFVEAKILEGNVGYLDLRGFAGMGIGKPMADAYMKLLANTDAVIVDLSKNGGGSPAMVQYLCSYFFDEKVHLNSLYWREGDKTTDFWTLDEVGGSKMPDVPLFVMTSSRTFSGAEEFSYNMQTQKRATLVGQTSGGGANPGGMMRINKDLGVFIPTGKAINPITKTNWEGVGVIPEVKTSPEESLNKTHELAMTAAEDYRSAIKEKGQKMLSMLMETLENYASESSDSKVHNGLKRCIDSGLLQEWDVNALGYQYLLNNEKPETAESIFKANTELHPNSPNVYDSYGEALAMKGDLEGSLKNYQKAVEIAENNEDMDVQLYRDNLKKIQDKIKAKK